MVPLPVREPLLYLKQEELSTIPHAGCPGQGTQESMLVRSSSRRGSRAGHSGVYACPQFLTQPPCSSMSTWLTMKKQETLISLNQAKLPWGT